MYEGPRGPHLNYATQYTRQHMDPEVSSPQISTKNRKPYRTAQQKKSARARAMKVHGTYYSPEPVTYHK